MSEKKISKLVLAIMTKEDYDEIIPELNRSNIFVTKLSTSGGFLKKENVTIMIGVEEDRLEETLRILEKAGRRIQTDYTIPTPVTGVPYTGLSIPVETKRTAGGVTIFVLNVEQFEKK